MAEGVVSGMKFISANPFVSFIKLYVSHTHTHTHTQFVFLVEEKSQGLMPKLLLNSPRKYISYSTKSRLITGGERVEFS